MARDANRTGPPDSRRFSRGGGARGRRGSRQRWRGCPAAVTTVSRGQRRPSVDRGMRGFRGGSSGAGSGAKRADGGAARSVVLCARRRCDGDARGYANEGGFQGRRLKGLPTGQKGGQTAVRRSGVTVACRGGAEASRIGALRSVPVATRPPSSTPSGEVSAAGAGISAPEVMGAALPTVRSRRGFCLSPTILSSIPLEDRLDRVRARYRAPAPIATPTYAPSPPSSDSFPPSRRAALPPLIRIPPTHPPPPSSPPSRVHPPKGMNTLAPSVTRMSFTRWSSPTSTSRSTWSRTSSRSANHFPK